VSASFGTCLYRADFDAPATFTRNNASGVFLGSWTCSGSPTTYTSTRIRIYVKASTNFGLYGAGLVREVWVWSLDNPIQNMPISVLYRYEGDPIYYDEDVAFDPCTSAISCGRLMSGGTFRLEATT
jgi:hypothetical protein